MCGAWNAIHLVTLSMQGTSWGSRDDHFESSVKASRHSGMPIRHSVALACYLVPAAFDGQGYLEYSKNSDWSENCRSSTDITLDEARFPTSGKLNCNVTLSTRLSARWQHQTSYLTYDACRTLVKTLANVCEVMPESYWDPNKIALFVAGGLPFEWVIFESFQSRRNDMHTAFWPKDRLELCSAPWPWQTELFLDKLFVLVLTGIPSSGRPVAR